MTLCSLSVNANNNNLIFTCSIANNKQILLYKDDNKIIYSFGKTKQKPEIILTREKNELNIKLGDFSGRYASNSIEIKNGSYVYKLATSVDRIAEEQKPHTSLSVLQGNKELTSLPCIEGSEDGSLLNIEY